MEAYNNLIGLIVDTISEFSDKLAVLAPTLEKQCETLKAVATNLQFAKELIFRIVVLIIADRFEEHQVLLKEKNPELWERVNLFGFDIKGLWLRPELTNDTKECIWSYVQLFVESCIQAANMKNLPPNIVSYDQTVKALLKHSSIVQGPALLALMKTQMGQMSLTDLTA